MLSSVNTRSSALAASSRTMFRRGQSSQVTPRECCAFFPSQEFRMSSEIVPVFDRASVYRTVNPGIARDDYADLKPSAPAVRVGVIGYGYWGPNIVRNFQAVDDCQVATICDKSPNALKRAFRANPGVELTTDFN